MNGEKNSQKALSLPSLTALRCFEVAARTEHFGRAADELHLTHGAISRAVRLLEEDLGVMLFERRQRRVFLTDAGERFYQAVREGLGSIRQTAQALRQQSRPQSLVLSCEPTLLMRWLIPRWPAFQALHPELDVHLMAGGGALSFGSGIDLAIRRNDFHWPAELYSQLLFEERTGPVCPPGKVAHFFEPRGDVQALRPTAPRLHTKTRPGAWLEWQQHAGTRRCRVRPSSTSISACRRQSPGWGSPSALTGRCATISRPVCWWHRSASSPTAPAITCSPPPLPNPAAPTTSW
ncbi:LysR family transcriptional regulator [Aeromonas caviae]|nr:LysR family transcriptional regulator [Aeromonas caviae]